MSNESSTDISVLVQCNDIQVQAVVGSVIERALTDAGFTDVNNRTMLKDGHALAPEEVPTLLDMIRQRAPEVFLSTITIDSVPGDDIDELSEDEADAEEE